jgi:hypothetical protein
MKYAYVNKDNKVENIMVATEEGFARIMRTVASGLFTGKWIKVTEETGIPRKNYTYNEEKNKFYSWQPYPSWSLDQDVLEWKAPKEKPDGNYLWNEDLQEWIEFKVNECPACD